VAVLWLRGLRRLPVRLLLLLGVLVVLHRVPLGHLVVAVALREVHFGAVGELAEKVQYFPLKVVWRTLDRVTLQVRTLSPAFVDDYLALEGESLLSGVGCYRMEGRGAQLFESIEGDYFTILGLPLLPVLAALRERGMLSV